MIRAFSAPLAAAVMIFLAAVQTVCAQTNQSQGVFPQSPRLQSIVDRAVESTLANFASKSLASNQLAVTLVDLTDPRAPAQASYRGSEQIYPASVIKLFYLVAVHRWMEDGKIEDRQELRRAMRDMIVDSLNEATGFIVDCLTGTTSGPELSPAELETWYAKRNAVNRYFTSLGYTNINVNRKPWCEGPYGREMQSVQLHKPNHRNWLTTDATARLLASIVNGQAVSAKRSAEMMDLLKRDPFDPNRKNVQACAYTGLALPSGSKLWSKAGLTSETRHDAAYVELPTGPRFVLVTFTLDHANERDIIPAIEGLAPAK
jgi:beta-lactamase class A